MLPVSNYVQRTQESHETSSSGMWGWLVSLSARPWCGRGGGVDVKAHMRYVHYAVRTSCSRCQTTFKELKNHMRHLLQVCGYNVHTVWGLVGSLRGGGRERRRHFVLKWTWRLTWDTFIMPSGRHVRGVRQRLKSWRITWDIYYRYVGLVGFIGSQFMSLGWHGGGRGSGREGAHEIRSLRRPDVLYEVWDYF